MNKQLNINLPLIKYEEEGEVIYQRMQDGYINATAMCKAVGKEWSNYHKATSTIDFLNELSRSLQIGRDVLIRIVSTGRNELRGTWIHPQIAMHLGQWLSPKFAVKVSKWVMDWLSGKRPQNNLPYHLKRYLANTKNVPHGYFSVLQEIKYWIAGCTLWNLVATICLWEM